MPILDSATSTAYVACVYVFVFVCVSYLRQRHVSPPLGPQIMQQGCELSAHFKQLEHKLNV